MNTVMKTAIASICGATIGYGIGTKYSSGAGAIIATVIGGVVGWIMFAPIEFLKVLKDEIKRMIEKAGGNLRNLCNEPWKKIIAQAFRDFVEQATFLIFIFGVVGLVGTSTIFLWSADPRTFYILAIIYGVACCFSGLLAITNISSLFSSCDRRKLLKRYEEKSSLFDSTPTWKMVFYAIPVVTPFVVVFYISKRLIWLGRRVPLIALSIWILTVKVCLKANSNGRMASLFGGALGTVIGLAAGHLAVALIAGLLLGMLASCVGARFPKGYSRTLRVLHILEIRRLRGTKYSGKPSIV